jgi:hypothetical protein
MTKREQRKLDVARSAAEDLSWHYTSPRALEGDLDILASALRDLPRRLTRIPRPDATGLCDIVQCYAEAKLITDNALEACTALQELTDIADYDVPDMDEFAANAEDHISDLKDQLEQLFTTLENRGADEND